jgi:hypothetical protein
MRRPAAFPIMGGLLCLAAASAASAGSGAAPPPAGAPLAPRSHEIMLSFSQSMGGGGGAALRPKFGFHVDQIRMTSQVRMDNPASPDAADPMERRSLVGWQIDGRSGMHASDMKLDLGGRLTYNVTRGGFSLPSGRSSVPASSGHPATVAGSGSSAANESEQKSFELHALPSSSVLHEVAAAAIASFKSSRITSIQQRSRLSDRPSSLQESR